jgi:hypothetical protein
MFHNIGAADSVIRDAAGKGGIVLYLLFVGPTPFPSCDIVIRFAGTIM